MKVRVGEINYAGARQVANEAGVNAARVVGSDLRLWARDTHREAARGGRNTNVWQEKRSAAGYSPAMEWGVLFATIDQSGEDIPRGYQFMVNYAELEFDLYRPLGALTLGHAMTMAERLY